MDGTKVADDNRAIRRNLELVGLLRGTIDIDEHLVARTYDITRRGGNVHGWLKGERTLVEDITAEHLLAIDQEVDGILDEDIGATIEIRRFLFFEA